MEEESNELRSRQSETTVSDLKSPVLEKRLLEKLETSEDPAEKESSTESDNLDEKKTSSTESRVEAAVDPIAVADNETPKQEEAPDRGFETVSVIQTSIVESLQKDEKMHGQLVENSCAIDEKQIDRTSVIEEKAATSLQKDEIEDKRAKEYPNSESGKQILKTIEALQDDNIEVQSVTPTLVGESSNEDGIDGEKHEKSIDLVPEATDETEKSNNNESTEKECSVTNLEESSVSQAPPETSLQRDKKETENIEKFSDLAYEIGGGKENLHRDTIDAKQGLEESSFQEDGIKDKKLEEASDLVTMENSTKSVDASEEIENKKLDTEENPHDGPKDNSISTITVVSNIQNNGRKFEEACDSVYEEQSILETNNPIQKIKEGADDKLEPVIMETEGTHLQKAESENKKLKEEASNHAPTEESPETTEADETSLKNEEVRGVKLEKTSDLVSELTLDDESENAVRRKTIDEKLDDLPIIRASVEKNLQKDENQGNIPDKMAKLVPEEHIADAVDVKENAATEMSKEEKTLHETQVTETLEEVIHQDKEEKKEKVEEHSNDKSDTHEKNGTENQMEEEIQDKYFDASSVALATEEACLQKEDTESKEIYIAPKAVSEEKIQSQIVESENICRESPCEEENHSKNFNEFSLTQEPVVEFAMKDGAEYENPVRASVTVSEDQGVENSAEVETTPVEILVDEQSEEKLQESSTFPSEEQDLETTKPREKILNENPMENETQEKNPEIPNDIQTTEIQDKYFDASSVALVTEEACLQKEDTESKEIYIAPKAVSEKKIQSKIVESENICRESPCKEENHSKNFNELSLTQEPVLEFAMKDGAEYKNSVRASVTVSEDQGVENSAEVETTTPVEILVDDKSEKKLQESSTFPSEEQDLESTKPREKITDENPMEDETQEKNPDIPNDIQTTEETCLRNEGEQEKHPKVFEMASENIQKESSIKELDNKIPESGMESDNRIIDIQKEDENPDKKLETLILKDEKNSQKEEEERQDKAPGPDAEMTSKIENEFPTEETVNDMNPNSSSTTQLTREICLQKEEIEIEKVEKASEMLHKEEQCRNEGDDPDKEAQNEKRELLAAMQPNVDKSLNAYSAEEETKNEKLEKTLVSEDKGLKTAAEIEPIKIEIPEADEICDKKIDALSKEASVEESNQKGVPEVGAGDYNVYETIKGSESVENIILEDEKPNEATGETSFLKEDEEQKNLEKDFELPPEQKVFDVIETSENSQQTSSKNREALEPSSVKDISEGDKHENPISMASEEPETGSANTTENPFCNIEECLRKNFKEDDMLNENTSELEARDQNDDPNGAYDATKNEIPFDENRKLVDLSGKIETADVKDLETLKNNDEFPITHAPIKKAIQKVGEEFEKTFNKVSEEPELAGASIITEKYIIEKEEKPVKNLEESFQEENEGEEKLKEATAELEPNAQTDEPSGAHDAAKNGFPNEEKPLGTIDLSGKIETTDVKDLDPLQKTIDELSITQAPVEETIQEVGEDPSDMVSEEPEIAGASIMTEKYALEKEEEPVKNLEESFQEEREGDEKLKATTAELEPNSKSDKPNGAYNAQKVGIPNEENIRTLDPSGKIEVVDMKELENLNKHIDELTVIHATVEETIQEEKTTDGERCGLNLQAINAVGEKLELDAELVPQEKLKNTNAKEHGEEEMLKKEETSVTGLEKDMEECEGHEAPSIKVFKELETARSGENIEKEIIKGEDALKNLQTISFGNETVEKRFPEDEKKRKIEEAVPELDHGYRNQESSDTINSTKNRISYEEVKETALVSTRQNFEATGGKDKIETITLKPEGEPKKNFDDAPVTDATTEKSSQGAETLEETYFFVHEEQLHEPINADEKTMEFATDKISSSKSLLAGEKLKNTSADSAAVHETIRPNALTDNSNLRNEEIPNENPDVSLITEVSGEAILPKDCSGKIETSSLESEEQIYGKIDANEIIVGEEEVNLPKEVREKEHPKDEVGHETTDIETSKKEESQQAVDVSPIRQASTDETLQKNDEKLEKASGLVSEEKTQQGEETPEILSLECAITDRSILGDELEGPKKIENTSDLVLEELVDEKIDARDDTEVTTAKDDEKPHKNLGDSTVTKASDEDGKIGEAELDSEAQIHKTIVSKDSIEQASEEISIPDDKVDFGKFVNEPDLKSHEKIGAEHEEEIRDVITEIGNAAKDSIEESNSSPSDLLTKSTKETLQTSGIVMEENNPTVREGELQNKQATVVQVEEVKADEDKDEEDDNDENKEESGSDAPVMVEASRDVDMKPVHKKSHNILSGVGSKVKHSIAKVKKAITGKSSNTKELSPK